MSYAHAEHAHDGFSLPDEFFLEFPRKLMKCWRSFCFWYLSCFWSLPVVNIVPAFVDFPSCWLLAYYFCKRPHAFAGVPSVLAVCCSLHSCCCLRSCYCCPSCCCLLLAAYLPLLASLLGACGACGACCCWLSCCLLLLSL
jgi:hypothetical protein